MQNIFLILFLFKKIFSIKLVSYLFAILGSIFNFSKFLNKLHYLLVKIMGISYTLAQFIKNQIKKDISFWPFLLNVLTYFVERIKNIFTSVDLNKSTEKKLAPKPKSNASTVLPISDVQPSSSKIKLIFVAVYRLFQLLLLLSVGSVIMEYNPSVFDSINEYSINFEKILSSFSEYLFSLTVLIGSAYVYLKDFLFDVYLKYFEFIGKIPGLLKEVLGYFIEILEKILQKIKNFFGIAVPVTVEVVVEDKNLPLPTSTSSIPENFPVELPWTLKEKNNSALDISSKNLAVSVDVPEAHAKNDLLNQFLWGTVVVITASVVITGLILCGAHLCGISLDTDLPTFVKEVGKATVEASDSSIKFVKNLSSASLNSLHGNIVGQNIAASNAHRLDLIQISEMINQNSETGGLLTTHFNSNLANIRQALTSGLEINQDNAFSPAMFSHYFGPEGGAASSVNSTPAQYPLPLVPNSSGEIDIITPWEAANLLQLEKARADNPPIVAPSFNNLLPDASVPVASQIIPANLTVNLAEVPEGYSVWNSVDSSPSIPSSPTVDSTVSLPDVSSPVSATPSVAQSPVQSPVQSPSSVISELSDVDKSVSSLGSDTPKALQVSSSLALAGVSQEALDAAAEVALKNIPVAIKNENVFYCCGIRRYDALTSSTVNKKTKKILTSPINSLIQVKKKINSNFNFNQRICIKNLFKMQARFFLSDNKYSSRPPLPIDWKNGKLMEFSPAEIKENSRIKNGFLFIKDYIADSNWSNAFEVFLTVELFEVLFEEFWNRVMNNFSDKQYVILLIRINYPDYYTTFDTAIRVSKFDKNSLLVRISGILASLTEEYRDDPVWGITLDYIMQENSGGKPLKDDFIARGYKEKISFPDKLLKKDLNKLSKFNLPLNNKYLSWGKVHYTSQDLTVIQDLNKDKKYFIQSLEAKTNRTSIEIKYKGESILKFEDVKESQDSFTRKINSSEYVIKNNQIILKTTNYKVDTLKSIQTDKKTN